MSPIYNTGGGATAPNSVAATKEETPTGTKIMRGGFNNDRSADDKRLSVSTTSRTTRSALSPIIRYYCRRNWYIDTNGYHQFHTTYDKIIINNNKNENKNVATPKQLERAPNNNNEEQEESELNNKDVNTEFEVSITPETTSRKEGVLKVRDRSKSNTNTSVATKKNTPTGQRETGGFKNDTGNRKSATSIITKSNLYALPDDDTTPPKEGVPPTGKRQAGRFINDTNTGNSNSLSDTASRTNLSSYIESNECYCTSYDKLDINDKNNNNKDVNNVDITPETTPRKEGVPKERNSSEPYKDNNKTHRKEGVRFIWYEQVPRLNTNSWIPVTAGLNSISNRKIVMPTSRFVTPTRNAYAALSEDNDDGGSLYPPISVPKAKAMDINSTNGMPSFHFVTSTHNVYSVLSEDDDDDDNDGCKLNSQVSLLKQKQNDNFFDNSIASKEGVGCKALASKVMNIVSTDGYRNTNKARSIIEIRTDDKNCDKQTNVAQSNTDNNTDINIVDPSKEGVDKTKERTEINVRPNNTDDVRHSRNDINRNKSDDDDGDPTKAGVEEKSVRSEEFTFDNNNNNTNGNNNNPSKGGVRDVDKNHDNNNGNTSKEGVRAINNNHLKEGVGKIAVRSNDTNNNVNKRVGDDPSKEGVPVVDDCHDNTSDCTPVPGLQGLSGDDWSDTDSRDSCYDDGEIGIRTNAMNSNNNVVQPIDNDHSNKIRVSGKEQTNTNHVIGIVIHEYNHNDHFIGNIIHECNHNNENEHESSNKGSEDESSTKDSADDSDESSVEDSDDDSDESSSIEDNSDDDSDESSVEDSDDDSDSYSDESSVEDSDDDSDFYIRTQCDWCYTNRCECNYPSDNSDDNTEYNNTGSDSESSEEEEDDNSDAGSDSESSEEEDDDNESSVDVGSPENLAVVAATMYHEDTAVYVSSDEEEEETDDEDSGVSYLSRGSTFYTYYGGEYFYDNNGDLHYCGQNNNEYDSDESGPGDNGIPDVISCSSNDDDSSDDDNDDDSSCYESCDCDDPKCDCDAEMRYNQYKRKHQLENPKLYELKFKLDNPTLFPGLHGYLQKVPKLRNYLYPKLNNSKYKQQMEELSESDNESDDSDDDDNDNDNSHLEYYTNNRNHHINNGYIQNRANNHDNHNNIININNNDVGNENASNNSVGSGAGHDNDNESDINVDDNTVNTVDNDDSSVEDESIDADNNSETNDIDADNNSDNDNDSATDDDTYNNESDIDSDEDTIDTNNDNDDSDDDIDDNSGDDDESTSIPKELQNYNAEGPYWSTNDRPSYATVAAKSSDDNNESTDVTIGAIILPRTATIQTLGLVSSTET